MCCNPAHLFLGTQKDNMQDCSRKGRNVAQAHPEKMALGEHHGNAKLTDTAVRTIREEWSKPTHQSRKELAQQYGITEHTVSMVAHYKAWKHVT